MVKLLKILKKNPRYINLLLALFLWFIIENILSLIFVAHPEVASLFGFEIIGFQVKILWAIDLAILVVALIFTFQKKIYGLYASLLFFGYRGLNFLISGIVIFSDFRGHLQKMVDLGWSTSMPVNPAEWTASLIGIIIAILSRLVFYGAICGFLIYKRQYFKK